MTLDFDGESFVALLIPQTQGRYSTVHYKCHDRLRLEHNRAIGPFIRIPVTCGFSVRGAFEYNNETNLRLANFRYVTWRGTIAGAIQLT